MNQQGMPVEGAEPLMPGQPMVGAQPPQGFAQPVPQPYPNQGGLQYPPQPQYAQPVPTSIGQPITPLAQAPIQNQPIVVNQVALPQLKTSPVTVCCPYCKQTVTTIVETQFNCAICCLCLMTGLFVWMCFQCCRDKDLSCNDATHRCPSCQAMIGSYSAC